MSWRYRMTGKAPNPAQQGTPRRLPEHTTPRGRWVMAAVAVVLALLTGMAHASELPCVEDPALIVMIALVYMGGVIAGVILGSIKTQKSR